MFSKVALRIIRLVRSDRFHDQPVMAHDILRLAGRGQMQPAQPVDMTRSRSSVRADRAGERRKMAGEELIREELIWMASLDGRSNFPKAPS